LWKAKCSGVLFWHIADDKALGEPRTFELAPMDSGSGFLAKVLYRLSNIVGFLIVVVFFVLGRVPEFGFYTSLGRGQVGPFWLLILACVEANIVSEVVLDLLVRRVTAGSAAAAGRLGPQGMSSTFWGETVAVVVLSIVPIILTVRGG